MICQATNDDLEKVISLLLSGEVIFVNTFLQELDEALREKRADHNAVKRFNQLCTQQPQVIAAEFIKKDINKDGLLNRDGFKGACIGAGSVINYNIPLNDLDDVFKLLASRGNFEYVSYFVHEVDNDS